MGYSRKYCTCAGCAENFVPCDTNLHCGQMEEALEQTINPSLITFGSANSSLSHRTYKQEKNCMHVILPYTIMHSGHIYVLCAYLSAFF